MEIGQFEQEVYTVEFADRHYNVVYYREIEAVGTEDARQQILLHHPDANIRAVTRKE